MSLSRLLVDRYDIKLKPWDIEHHKHRNIFQSPGRCNQIIYPTYYGTLGYYMICYLYFISSLVSQYNSFLTVTPDLHINWFCLFHCFICCVWFSQCTVKWRYTPISIMRSTTCVHFWKITIYLKTEYKATFDLWMSYYHHSSSERCMKANSQFYASIASECAIVFLYN